MLTCGTVSPQVDMQVPRLCQARYRVISHMLLNCTRTAFSLLPVALSSLYLIASACLRPFIEFNSSRSLLAFGRPIIHSRSVYTQLIT